MATERPTVRDLEERISGVEGMLGQMTGTLGRVDASMQVMQENSSKDSARLWTALGQAEGLGGISGGLAALVEVLSPMHRALPPSTADPLDCGVAEAIGDMRAALGGDDRDLNFSSLVTAWDGPVPVIGQAVCPPDGAGAVARGAVADPTTYPEAVR